MKRDFDLVRKLLMYFEEKVGPEAEKSPVVEGYEEAAIKYHLVLLHDAGFLRCEAVKSSTSDRVIYVMPFELTWDGHEFLDKIRSDTIWQQTKKKVLESGAQLTVATITSVATQMIGKALGTG